MTQLVEHLDQVIKLLEYHEAVDVAYLDFAKAYDKVDFGLLLQRLEEVGIQGKVQAWIAAFLKGRKQRVKVNGVIGKVSEVVSGIPQGTILGHLLFILYIAPLSQLPHHCQISSYADDTKLTIGRDGSDSNPLQRDLDTIYSWVEHHNMAFNASKFMVMTYGESDFPPVYLDSAQRPISQVSSTRDLGVILQSNGKFDQHIQEKVSKASQLCGWIFRTFKTRDKLSMLTLYKSLILPHLDYCSLVWSPSSVGDLQRIESVQRLLTRNIEGMRHLSYWDRLKRLNLHSVERRFERYKIIFVFKCLHDLVPNPGISFNSNPRTGIYCHIIVPPRGQKKCVRSLQSSFVLNRAPTLYNCLPKDLRVMFNDETNPLDKFKTALDDYLKKIPDQPTVSGLSRPSNSNSIPDQKYYMLT